MHYLGLNILFSLPIIAFKSECLYYLYSIFLTNNGGVQNWLTGVPIVSQQKQIWLVSMRMQVGSLALLSGLGIQRCHELWHRSQMRLGSCIAVLVVWAGGYSSNSPLAWELLYAAGVALKSKKTNKAVLLLVLTFLFISYINFFLFLLFFFFFFIFNYANEKIFYF